MPNKRKNIFYIVLGSLVVLLGLFMFQATQDVALPPNAKKEGNMIHIDLSEGATNEVEKREASFTVPDKFKPRVSKGAIAFYFKYPEGTPYSGDDFPLPTDQIRVIVEHHVKPEALPSEYILRRTQPKDGPLGSTPWFFETKDGLKIYKYRIKTSVGTYFNFVNKDNQSILIDDPGDWSSAYVVYRKLSPNIQLTYLFNKHLIRDQKHFIGDIQAIDNVALRLVKSFQS